SYLTTQLFSEKSFWSEGFRCGWLCTRAALSTDGREKKQLALTKRSGDLSYLTTQLFSEKSFWSEGFRCGWLCTRAALSTDGREKKQLALTKRSGDLQRRRRERIKAWGGAKGTPRNRLMGLARKHHSK